MQVLTKGPVSGAERQSALAFLRAAGYSQRIEPADEVFTAWRESEVIGAVRLAREHDVLVLRGMRVREDFRRHGVGRQLLLLLDGAIGESICWCVAWVWLTEFYGAIGFTMTDGVDAPAFLVDRHRLYVQQGLNVAVMVRR